MMKKRIFFLVRYSVLSSKPGAWVIGRNTPLEDYKARLFSDSRMQLHSRLFFGLTLPSLDEAIRKSGLDATCIVMTSTELPSVHKKALYQAAARHPWLQIREVTPEVDYGSGFEAMVAEELDKDDEDEVLCASIRIDDDDAVSRDFLRQLGNYLTADLSGFAITLAKGYKAFVEGDKITHFVEDFHAKASVGLTYLTLRKRGSGPAKTVYSFGDHMKIDRKTRLIIDARKAAFIRAIHDESDISQDKGDRRRSTDTKAQLRKIEEAFVLLPMMLARESA